ncbi:hypothetical protein LEP1GSC133_0002 [Leptospira borgpetersenii serovar Pomona str. 200901868]|uniref:Uncharacterized protein n=1 Tax=Leptospira borgpetersenii serovar Pomona str. 200901868 TaxID=1192866 RepID=M6WH83_LEPBO|nr:hypothetical protein LEP1GSC133_0002 [Leptospira borgpetersenii serovar Pomona str. 200901868]
MKKIVGLRAGLKTSKMWELPRKLDNNKTYSKVDDRQKGRELPFYGKFKMNISVEVLRPALSPKEVYVDVSKFRRLGLNLSKGSHKNVLF